MFASPVKGAMPTHDPIGSLRTALAGRYEIGREIGQGAFATVYLANDSRHDRQVALKVLNAEHGSESGELRFIQEIRMLAGLQHPNILPLHDSGHVEALLYYLMPYVSGETLRARMTRERQLPIDAAGGLSCRAADAPPYAHPHGIRYPALQSGKTFPDGSTWSFSKPSLGIPRSVMPAPRISFESCPITRRSMLGRQASRSRRSPCCRSRT